LKYRGKQCGGEQHQITAEPLNLPAANENKVNLSLATFNEYFVTKICQC